MSQSLHICQYKRPTGVYFTYNLSHNWNLVQNHFDWILIQIIRSLIGVCHNSWAVETCAKLWPHQMIIFHIRWICIFTGFEWSSHKLFVKWAQGHSVPRSLQYWPCQISSHKLNRHQTILQNFLNFFLNLILPGVPHLYKQLPNGQYLSDLCKMCNLDANLWKSWIGDHRILTYIFKWERLNTAGHSHSVSIGHWVAPLHND